MVAYEPHPEGSFRARRTLGTDPTAAVREIDPAPVGQLIESLDRQPGKDRLYRAIEHYGETLRLIYPASSLQAAMHAWIAVECLTEVIANRLKRDLGTDHLASHLGVAPRSPDEQIDPRDVRGALRRQEIFADNAQVYRDLRYASDGVEHGFLGFGDARSLTDAVFPNATALIREALLRECGLDASAAEVLLSGPYENPLPLWRPYAIATGTFGEKPSVDLSTEPAPVRVEAELDMAKIRPGEHAAEAELRAEVHGHGLDVAVREIELAAPGRLVAALGDSAPAQVEESSR